MKVGDYVRFKTLSKEIKIGKVVEIIEPDNSNEFSPKKYNVYDLDNNEATVDDYVIKTSPNIIDLIEVGDYVNGLKVAKVEDNVIIMVGLLMRLGEEDIKSILTKEQFEKIEYVLDRGER